MRGVVLPGAMAAVLIGASAVGAETDDERAGEAAGEAAGDAVECVATAVYYEARGEADAGKDAVAHVILNRVEHEDFPDTPCEVVEEGCEFSFMCDGRPERMADADDREEAFAVAESAVEGDAEGERADPTDGALFFHARSVQLDWFETLERVGAIGGHVFYR